jgi:transmembrane sensor
MDSETNHFKQLLQQFLEGQMEGAQLESFVDLLQHPENNRLFSESIDNDFREGNYIGLSETDQLKDLYDRIHHKIGVQEDIPDHVKVRHLWPSMASGWKVAASLLVLFGALVFYYLSRDVKLKKVSEVVVVKQQDISPGRQTAQLILADGSTIVLDNMHNGVVASQNGVDIHLNTNQIAYERVQENTGKPIVNTLQTPKGGQYQLTLADGTKVWLNAASSITFPVAFTGRDRKVAITGEVYFEVKKNALKPFIVQTRSEQIEVIGTHFNVNCYTDEPQTQTTLLEGVVKIGNAILKPGQAYKAGVVQAADVNQAISWTKGTFNFNHMPLDAVMRQISRWYDVEIIYPRGIPKVEFWGEVQSTLPLSEMLAGFHAMDIHFKIEGKKLYIQP